ALLKENFPEAEITVSGDDGVHMAAEIISPQFSGLSRIKQHQLVYAAMKGKMDGANAELHALQLTTKVPQ
ncbi:MAG: BolA/IbaG family iron-sulfur metabolism protein, partial [Pseudomonadota bacterium]